MELIVPGRYASFRMTNDESDDTSISYSNGTGLVDGGVIHYLDAMEKCGQYIDEIRFNADTELPS